MDAKLSPPPVGSCRVWLMCPCTLGVCVVGIYAPEGCQHGTHTNVRCCLVFSSALFGGLLGDRE